MDLFPLTDLTEGEVNQVIEIFSMPIIVKYLQNLASATAANLVATLPKPDEYDEFFIRKHIYGQGQLQVLDQLLAFQHASKS